MKFIRYSGLQARECKIDWDAAVEVTEAVRRALHPHDPEVLQVGRLRRPFLFKPPAPGRRSRRVFVKHPAPEPVPHEQGAIVFAYPDESCFFIEVT